jgi:hypothetical protein
MRQCITATTIALAACAAAVAVCGQCAAATPQAALVQTRNRGSDLGKLFVADTDAGAVYICSTNLKFGSLPPADQLSGVSNPVQLAIDAAGTVYVANGWSDASGSGSVTVYPRGQTTPSRTLTNGLNMSTGVAVDGAGTVYVSNKYAGSIAIFPAGASSPSETVTANLSGPDGLALDSAGDLFIADSSANDVLVLAHGSQTPQSLHLAHLHRPFGVVVDPSGALYVSNLDGPSSSIAVYPSGATTPARTFAMVEPSYGPGAIGQASMLSITGDLLIASEYSTVFYQSGTWFNAGGIVSVYPLGSKQQRWSLYGIGGPWSAVFQPDHA